MGQGGNETLLNGYRVSIKVDERFGQQGPLVHSTVNEAVANELYS